MCQSIQNGGKRCFRHSSGTKATLSYIHLKTGIDKEQIYAIMKELRKEGRHLEAPTPEEIEKYFDLEEFKAKYDTTLTEKEKVTILKQLLSARSEANEQGVSGGVFHVWKNALKRTVDRFKKPMIAMGLTGAVLFGAAGCTGAIQPDPTEPAPNPSASSSVECSTENPGPWGDAIAKEEVTDDQGTYCKITIDPESTALVYDSSKVDMASLEAYGFTEEDAEKAQDSAVHFIVEQALDSQVLDTYTGTTSGVEWVESNKNLFNPDYVSLFETAAANDQLPSAVLVSGENFPLLRRDGEPRTSGIAISVDKIMAKEGTTAPYIQVVASVSAVYPAKNSEIIDFSLKSNPEWDEAMLKDGFPFLFENAEAESDMTIYGTFSTAYTKDNLTQVSGSATDWEMSIGQRQ